MAKQTTIKTAKSSVSRSSVRSKSTCKKFDSLAKSFTNVGIPTILETQLLPQRSGISAHLQRVGNILIRPKEHSLKIKL